MRGIASAGSFSVRVDVGACAAQQPPAPPPLNLVTEAAPQPEATPPPPTGAELLAQQPAEVRDGGQGASAGRQMAGLQNTRTDPLPVRRRAAADRRLPPLRTTDIQLQPGETITDVAMGDTERWMATPASSGDPRNPVPHLALKPQAPGIETNLTIYTTKHIYHLTPALARKPRDAGGRVLLSRRTADGDERGRRRGGEGEAGSRRSAWETQTTS